MRRNDFFKSLLFGGGNPASRVELETETLPYTFYTQPKTLKNYRIYGNTVNGESVGDRTANLFNPDSPWNMNGSHGKSSPYVFPKSTGDLKRTYFMTVNPGDVYTITSTVPGDRLYIYGYTTTMDPTAFTVNYPLYPDIMIRNNETVPNAAYTFTVPNGVVMISIYYSYEHLPTDFQIAEGSVSLSYEPYGYKIPVIVNEQTTNIYLDEPLANSNDIADYIDYKLQKRFNADGTSEDVALPEITVFDNENEISFDTTVQPSKIYLKGSISENEVTISQQVQNLQTMRSLQPLSLDDDDFQLDVMPTESDLQLDVIIPTANLNRIEDDENAE